MSMPIDTDEPQAGTAGLGLGTRPARADATTDTAIFDFPLTERASAVTGAGPVPFENTAIAYFAEKIAVDGPAHVRFIRAVRGNAAVNEPDIDFTNAFTQPAVSAGLADQGQVCRRPPQQVPSVVHGGNKGSTGLFFPNGATGAYTTSS